MPSQYRTDTIEKIIQYAIEEYNLQDWSFDFKDCTPEDAFAAIPYAISYDYSQEETRGIGGLAYATNQTIFLFWKGLKSFGQRMWIIAHEIGHAVHFTNHPELTDPSEREIFADNIANQILDELGL